MNKVLFSILISACVANCYQQNPTYKGIKSNWQEKLLKHLNTCIEESGVDPILAVRLLPHGEYPGDDYKLKCFVKCIGYNLGAFNEDGTAKNEDIILKVLEIENPKVVDEGYLHSCFAIKLSDPCETGFKISECIHLSVGKAVHTLHPEQ